MLQGVLVVFREILAPDGFEMASMLQMEFTASPFIAETMLPGVIIILQPTVEK